MGHTITRLCIVNSITYLCVLPLPVSPWSPRTVCHSPLCHHWLTKYLAHRYLINVCCINELIPNYPRSLSLVSSAASFSLALSPGCINTFIVLISLKTKGGGCRLEGKEKANGRNRKERKKEEQRRRPSALNGLTYVTDTVCNVADEQARASLPFCDIMSLLH